jgi:hypothetical protein
MHEREQAITMIVGIAWGSLKKTSLRGNTPPATPDRQKPFPEQPCGFRIAGVLPFALRSFG